MTDEYKVRIYPKRAWRKPGEAAIPHACFVESTPMAFEDAVSLAQDHTDSENDAVVAPADAGKDWTP